MKNNIYICTTQYHLFNIVNIIHGFYQEDRNYLIVLDCIPTLVNRIYEQAIKADLFEKVIIVEVGQIKGNFKSYLSSIRRILFPKNIKMILENPDRVFISGTEIYSRIIAFNFLKNPNTKLFYYEDGMESYDTLLNRQVTNRSNRILKMRFGYYLIERCVAIYVYKPEYVSGNKYEIPVKKIPTIAVGGSWAIELKKIFGRASEIFPREKIIYFDAWFNSDKARNENRKIVSSIISIFGEKLIVKPHPSNLKEWSKIKNVKVFESVTTFETLCLTENINDKTLISMFSTACILPKMIFNEEPRIILTYRLYKKYCNEWKKFDTLFENVKNDYADKQKFIILNDARELDNIKLSGKYVKNN